MVAMKEHDEFAVIEAYVRGINSYIKSLKKSDLPLEFKLFNYVPELWQPLYCFLFVKSMTWTLSSGPMDSPGQAALHKKLGAEAFEQLFPRLTPYAVPIIPEPTGMPPKDRAVYGPHKEESIVINDGDGFFLPPLPAAELSKSNGTSPAREVKSAIDFVNKFVNEKNREWQWRTKAGGLGSNDWVIDAEKSASGIPILAYDPHVWLNLPSMWYEAHLVTPDLDVRGVALLASPYIIYGFNRFIAWGGTTLMADVVDGYVEQVDSTRDNYLYKGEWHPIQWDTVRFKVRGGKEVFQRFGWTIHGPILEWPDKTIAMKWVGHEPTEEWLAISRLNRARNYDEFVEALSHYHVSAQNFAYADIYGNIAMWCTGRFPIRANGDGRFLVDGSTGENEWTGYVPFAELPHSVNPAQHYLLSANQVPTGPNYPYSVGSAWEESYRARRIDQLLRSKEKISFEDMQRFQGDIIDLRARRFLPAILTAGERLGKDIPQVQEVLSHLRDWNGRADMNLVAPLIFDSFLKAYRKNTWSDDLQIGAGSVVFPETEVLEQLTLTEPDSRWFDDVRTEQRETRDDIIIKSLMETAQVVKRMAGADSSELNWGRQHRTVINHLSRLNGLGFPAFANDGNSSTVNCQSGTVAPNWRMVVELSEDGRRVGVYPGGQSGNPASDHYDDGVRPWAKHQYFELTLPASPAEIPADQIESVLNLQPRRNP